jgi:hypothetical protein
VAYKHHKFHSWYYLSTDENRLTPQGHRYVIWCGGIEIDSVEFVSGQSKGCGFNMDFGHGTSANAQFYARLLQYWPDLIIHIQALINSYRESK